MPENNLSQKNTIIIGIVLVLALAGGYYWYSSNSDTVSAPVAEITLDPSLFNPDIRALYEAKDSINFKDLSFMQKAFYTELKDNTVEIPSIKPTGRPNPFIPYASP